MECRYYDYPYERPHVSRIAGCRRLYRIHYGSYGCNRWHDTGTRIELLDLGCLAYADWPRLVQIV